jgi:hypothetical protein
MNKPPNLEQRKSRPHSLGGAFGELLRKLGRHSSDADLSARWNEIMGSEIADIADMAGISKGTRNKEQVKNCERVLTVKAKNPALALALSYKVSDIRARANKYFGYDAIAAVKVKK